MFDITRRVLAEAVRIGRDRLSRRTVVPRDISRVTKSWLGEVLGGTVAEIEVHDATAGTTSRARLRLDGDDVPSSVFIKLAPMALATRAFVDLMALGRTETRFYREIRPELPVAAPAVYATREETETGRFALLLEDLAARQCRFGDVRTVITDDEAVSVVTALARLHAMFWNSPRFPSDLSWVVSHTDDPNNALVRPLVRAAFRRVSKSHAGLVPAGASALIDRRVEIERALGRAPVTLLHGDPHLGNMYFDDGTPGFLDWQVLRRGVGLRDLTYFVVLSLEAETRRKHEADLLRAYLEELAARGVETPSFNDAWDRYRREAGYAWIAALVTTGLRGLQAQDIATTGLRRAAAALEDLETVSAVRRILD